MSDMVKADGYSTSEDGRSPDGSGSRASPQAPAGLGHSASIPNAVLSAVAAWLAAKEESYSGWNPHDEDYDRGYNNAVQQTAKELVSAASESPSDEASLLREFISDALAKDGKHTSDCAVYSAPAELPGTCDCEAPVMNAQASEAAAERAVAVLRSAIEAAENSNQAGENFVCLAASAPSLYEALEAQERAEDAFAGCEECEGQGDWTHCGPCSVLFGDAVYLRRAALARARGEA